MTTSDDEDEFPIGLSFLKSMKKTLRSPLHANVDTDDDEAFDDEIITVPIIFPYDYGIGEIKFISVRGRKCADARRQIRQIQDFTGVYGEKCVDAV